MNWYLLYLFIGLTAALVSALTTPFCRRLSWRINWLDRPLGEFHKKHDRITPVLGGLAMLIAWLFIIFGGYLAASLLLPRLPREVADAIHGLRDPELRRLLLVIALGGIMLCLLGMIDDKRPLGPFVKLGLQVLLCSVVASYPHLQVKLFVAHPLLNWGVTLFWFIFIINAFNFFDNMDGLAAGVAVIASALFAVVAALRGQFFVAALGATTAGTALGFYLHNCAPATIFMGDAGSHFLGFMLAVQGTLTKFYLDDQSPTIMPMFIPLLILALPIFDTFAVVLIRLQIGKPIYSGDHNHISHRFRRLGMGPGQAVGMVHLLALAIGLGGVAMLWLPGPGAILISLQVVAMLTLVSFLHRLGYAKPAPAAPPPAPPPKPGE